MHLFQVVTLMNCLEIQKTLQDQDVIIPYSGHTV